MAGQSQVNQTAVKLGVGFLQANSAAAKSTATVEDNSRLPKGIENGVAQIVSMKIQPVGPGKKNSGKPMFVAQAVVVKPEYHNGVRVAGRRTSMMEMLCDTPESSGKRKTVKDHVEHVYAYLRTLGVDTNMLAACKTEAELTAKLNAIFALLVKKKTTISFRTWEGKPTEQYPNPQVNESWGGLAQVVADTSPPEATVDDNSGPAEDTPLDGAPPDGDDAGGGVAVADGEDGSESQIGELTDDEVDALVAVADGEDEGQEKDDAGVRIADWAKENGVDEDTQAKAANWAEVVEWVRSGVPTEEPALAVGSVVKYKTPSAPGKPSKTVQCEIKKFYKVKGAEVADLLNLTDKRTKYAAVPVEKLEAV